MYYICWFDLIYEKMDKNKDNYIYKYLSKSYSIKKKFWLFLNH